MDERSDEKAALGKIIYADRQRRAALRLQAAQQGSSTRPEISIEIEELTTKINTEEEELRLLEIEGAVDQWPLPEAKYRELLAETWNTDRGLPTTVGLEHLERIRLELAVKRERAQELEHDIRARLAEDTFL